MDGRAKSAQNHLWPPAPVDCGERFHQVRRLDAAANNGVTRDGSGLLPTIIANAPNKAPSPHRYSREAAPSLTFLCRLDLVPRVGPGGDHRRWQIRQVVARVHLMLRHYGLTTGGRHDCWHELEGIKTEQGGLVARVLHEVVVGVGLLQH